MFLVVAFHSESGSASGGFIGVDVFFVLSGYLVTQLLLRDLGRATDRLRRFYARRYRRLLPAAFVTLVVSAIAFELVATAAEVADSESAFAPVPVRRELALHLPVGRLLRGRHRPQPGDPLLVARSRGAVLSLVAVAARWLVRDLAAVRRRERMSCRSRWPSRSAGFCRWSPRCTSPTTNLNRAYYGTDTRGVPTFRRRVARTHALVVHCCERTKAAYGADRGSGRRRDHRSGHVGIRFRHHSSGRRGDRRDLRSHHCDREREEAASPRERCRNPSPPYLGRLSYGIYLWHWPVIFVLTRKTSIGPVAVFVLTCVLATASAATSYHALELRIRLSGVLDGYPNQVIAAGLTLSLLGGLVVVPAILHQKHTSVLKATKGVDPTKLDWRSAKDDIPPIPDCSLAKASSCTVIHGTGTHILLLGDSNARMYIPAFRRIARNEGLTLSIATYPVCPWQRDLYYFKGVRDCEAKKKDWYGGLLDVLDPDVIVVANRPDRRPRESHRDSHTRGLSEAGFETGRVRGAGPDEGEHRESSEGWPQGGHHRSHPGCDE